MKLPHLRYSAASFTFPPFFLLLFFFCSNNIAPGEIDREKERKAGKEGESEREGERGRERERKAGREGEIDR